MANHTPNNALPHITLGQHAGPNSHVSGMRTAASASSIPMMAAGSGQVSAHREVFVGRVVHVRHDMREALDPLDARRQQITEIQAVNDSGTEVSARFRGLTQTQTPAIGERVRVIEAPPGTLPRLIREQGEILAPTELTTEMHQPAYDQPLGLHSRPDAVETRPLDTEPPDDLLEEARRVANSLGMKLELSESEVGGIWRIALDTPRGDLRRHEDCRHLNRFEADIRWGMVFAELGLIDYLSPNERRARHDVTVNTINAPPFPGP